MSADGRYQHNLSRTPASDGAPTWSADGSRIFFHSDRSQRQNDAYVMNADGSRPVRLTDGVRRR